MELFLDVLGESLVDTAKMLPFLFLAYLLIEYIETRHGERIEALLAGMRPSVLLCRIVEFYCHRKTCHISGAVCNIESSLPEKFKGMVKNEDQDR